MGDPDDQDNQPNPGDTWLQKLGVSADNFNRADSPVANTSSSDDGGGWSFNPVDPNKTPLPISPPPIYLPPDPAPPKTIPPEMWREMPKRDDTPEWKKWQKAVKDWCEDHHVDLGPIMDMAKDKLNQKKTDDPNDDLVQPDHKENKGDPPKYDDDSDTKTGPTKYAKPPAADDSGSGGGPGDYNVPDGDTANV